MFECGDRNAPIADEAGANLTVADVWDGPNQIAHFGALKLLGEHRFSLDTNNVFELSTPLEVIWDIELAVHETFTQDQSVTFAAAGADFEAWLCFSFTK
jgi:hypothetical protein